MFLAFSPAEVLYPSNVRQENLPGFIRERAPRPAAPELFKTGTAAKRLSSALNAPRLAGFGIDEDDPCVGPAWAVLDYLSATQFSSVRHVLRITPLAAKGRMTLDAATQRNLELTPVFEPQQFDTPSELKPVPRDNPAFIDIIQKKDRVRY